MLKRHRLLVEKLFDKAGDGFTHAKIALLRQIGELIDVYERHFYYKEPLRCDDIVEEVGDIIFYLYALDLVHNKSAKNIINALGKAQSGKNFFGRFGHGTDKPTPQRFMDELHYVIAEANYLTADRLKRGAPEFYEEVVNNLCLYFLPMCVDLTYALEANYKKLNLRYPDGKFTTKDARERKDKCDRKENQQNNGKCGRTATKTRTPRK